MVWCVVWRCGGVEVWRRGGVEVVVEAAGVKVQAKSAAW